MLSHSPSQTCWTSGREYSDDTARLIDQEISKILHEQEVRARALLTKHRGGLDLVAEALLERETIDGAEVGALVQQALTATNGSGSADSATSASSTPTPLG